MAIRNIIKKGDKTLETRCRPVTEFDRRLHTLIDDMKDTLESSGGVGLAAPQVGVLRRVVLVMETNVPEDGEEYIIELINPEIIEVDGEQNGPEGCLSVPGQYGLVTRPNRVIVKAQDRFGKGFTVEGEQLTARCFCHELDHLEGILFTERAERMLDPDELKSEGED
ncbi:MAG: peptide deformylase [Clostridiales bacterium]|nr:peptide deformylase [Clostridiales bacterium]